MIGVKSFDYVHDTRRLYRSLLDCMARPGKINSISALLQTVPGDLPCSNGTYAIGRTLLDHQVGFYLYTGTTGDAEAVNYLQWLTGGVPLAVKEADYLFFDSQPSPEQIAEVMHSIRVGTLLEPEKSATMIIRVAGVSHSSEHGQPMVLHGPGINGRRTLFVDGLHSEWLHLRAERNSEYPTGCDFILYGEDGNLTALPRTTVIESGGEI